MKLFNVKNANALFNNLLNQLELYSLRARTRKQLLKLDEHLLKDIGLTQQQAVQESKRLFWQSDDLINDDFINKASSGIEASIKTGPQQLVS